MTLTFLLLLTFFRLFSSWVGQNRTFNGLNVGKPTVLVFG